MEIASECLGSRLRHLVCQCGQQNSCRPRIITWQDPIVQVSPPRVTRRFEVDRVDEVQLTSTMWAQRLMYVLYTLHIFS